MLLRRALLYGSKFDPLYEAVLVYAVANSIPLPDATLQAKQNQYALDLRAAGLLTKKRVLWVYAGGYDDFSLINWMNPGTFTCLENGTLSYTSEGWSSNGTTGFLDTQWRPIDDGGGLYTLNDMHIAHYLVGSFIEVSSSFGVGVGVNTNAIRFVPRNASNQTARVVNSSTNVSNANSDASGYWYLDRTGGGNTDGQLRRNNTLISNTVGVSTLLPSLPMFVCAFNSNGTPLQFNTRVISVLSAGASLNSTERTDDYNAFMTYFNSL